VRLHGLHPRIAIYSILASLALIPLASAVMSVVISYVDLPEEWLESAYELVRAEDIPGLLYAWVVAALMAALGEEFVFRGVLQNALSARYSHWVAILLTSGVFGVLHVWRFPAAFILGAFLGTLYVVTGTLVAPILAHLTINSVVVFGAFLIDRADQESLPDWIARDAAAPSAVLIASLALFVLLMALIRKATQASCGRIDVPASRTGMEGGL
jgi:membrane protease YdiL (CAAX protease family)